MNKLTVADISIRTQLRPGDIGVITFLHGTLYHEEFGFGISFESYVAGALSEFYDKYDPERDRIWICEHRGEIIGSIVLMGRAHETAQLRFFLIHPDYRKIGLGKFLILQCIDFARRNSYHKIFLWTTDQLPASKHLYLTSGFKLTEEKFSEDFGVSLMEQSYELIL